MAEASSWRKLRRLPGEKTLCGVSGGSSQNKAVRKQFLSIGLRKVAKVSYVEMNCMHVRYP